MLWIIKALLIFILATANAWAVDISNPAKFLFASDKVDKIIDVIDLSNNLVVYRFETEYRVDGLVVTPYAPLLFYSNVENKLIVAINLDTKKVIKKIELNMAPRHIVLDTTGARVGVTDSEKGGFALIAAYQQAVVFQLTDFPATADVLFDPNEIDIYFSNNKKGSLGFIDTNVQRYFEMTLEDGKPMNISSPSRSLDGRYLYLADEDTGEIYGINAYSRVIYKTFNIGKTPARPYTTPEGTFLYLMDEETGRFVSFEQNRFTEYADFGFNQGVDLVTVGRFDRINLFMSSNNNQYHLYDNFLRKLIGKGKFKDIPVSALASADGRTAYVAFHNSPQIAALDLESQEIKYLPAVENGIQAFTLGLSNTVCH